MIFTITEERERDETNSPLYTLDVDGDTPPDGHNRLFTETWDRAAAAMREGDTLIERHIGSNPVTLSYADVQESIRLTAEFLRGNG